MTSGERDVVTVIETHDTEAEAVKAMHRYARNLRRLRKTSQFGVFIEKRRSTWYLCLNDRRASTIPRGTE